MLNVFAFVLTINTKLQEADIFDKGEVRFSRERNHINFCYVCGLSFKELKNCGLKFPSNVLAFMLLMKTTMISK
jgi:hypothetical protein